MNRPFQRRLAHRSWPTLANPALSVTNPITGNPFLGGFNLVNTPDDPQRGLRPERYNLFAPRAGLAYRLTDSTVIRGGGGIYFVPSTVNFPEGPTQAAIAYLVNNIGTSQDNGATYRDLGLNGQGPFSDPFPTGIATPPFRGDNFNKAILGTSPRAPLRDESFPGYTEQWNLAIQHQLKGDLTVEAAYSGLHGVHLPIGLQLNQLPLSIDCEIAGSAEEERAADILSDEEPVPSDSDVSGDAGVLQVAIVEVRSDGTDLAAGALLNRIARACGAERLIKQVLKVDLLIFESDRV